jgi:hypothetical protein
MQMLISTLKADIDLAFRTGRAAIVANDYVTRDAQIDKGKNSTSSEPYFIFKKENQINHR